MKPRFKGTRMKTSTLKLFLQLALLSGIICGAALVCPAADKVATWGDNTYDQLVMPGGLNNVKALAAGSGHSLVLMANGTVASWGYNAYGAATPPAGLNGVVRVAAGGSFNLALRANGTVVAWGNNSWGQTNVPAGLSRVAAIATGGTHGLALQADGTVRAWGNLPAPYSNTNIPAGLTDVVAIAAGGFHSLALKSDGTVRAWGWNQYGQTNVPATLSNVIAIAAGYRHNLALRDDGTVAAWGNANEANLPSGLSNVIAIAAGDLINLALKADGTLQAWGLGLTNLPPGISNVTAIACGAVHYLALVPEGPPELLTQPASTVVPYQSNLVLSVTANGYQPLSYRWRSNGVLFGDTSRIYGALTPALTIANAQFSDTATYTVVVSNAFGSVQSTGAIITVSSPPIITTNPVSQTVLAGTNLTLAASAIGTPPLNYQWLFNGSPLNGAVLNQLGLTNAQSLHSGLYSLLVSNAYGVTESSPALVTVLESVPYILKQLTNTAAFLGGVATFAVEARGSTPMTYQWRFNGIDILNATNPVLTLSSLGYEDAGFYTVVISNHVGTTLSAKVELTIRQVAVWGSSIFPSSSLPSSATNLVAISAGPSYLLGLKADGTVAVFPGTLPLFFVPTNVPTGLNSVSALAAGQSHCLALKSNGTVVAWGVASGIRNPLPPYNTTNLAAIVPVGLSNVIAVAAGDYLSLALKADGKVVSWGGYTSGTLGTPWDVSVVFTNVPANLSNVVAIAAGTDQSLALKSDGRVVAWSNGTNVPSGLSNVIAIACSGDLGLALQTNGRVVAWSTVRTSPVPVPPFPRRGLIATNVPATLSNVVAIAAGSDGAIGLALKVDGTVTMWGYNLTAPLTNSVPAGLANVFAITAGGGFMAALVGDGTPHLTLQPASQTVAKGATVRLNARAVGVQPMSYQWQLNDVNLPGATGADLIIPNVAGSDTGDYRVVVSNPRGNITSTTATLTIPFSTNLAAALNATNLVWLNSISAPWFAQIRETHDGDVAAQSGPIGNNQQSLLQATVTGPGTLRFWWKVSSEQGYDRLWFSMDYQNWAAWISGETDWQQFTFPIPAGSHTLNWAYTKDASVSAGQDAGWLDEVTFTPATALNLGAAQQLSDGTFAFWSRDPNGRELLPFNLPAIEVQASTNLRDWVALPGVCTLTNGALLIRDQTSTNFPMRFYRVIER